VKTEWTAEPWSEGVTHYENDKRPHVEVRDRDYERARICVNALAGIPSEVLADGVMGEMRDQLKQIIPFIENGTFYDDYDDACVRLNKLRAVLAKLEGKK
jgi:hypothetical protein